MISRNVTLFGVDNESIRVGLHNKFMTKGQLDLLSISNIEKPVNNVYFLFIALDKPVIERFSEDVSIPEGKGVKLEVMFRGSPTPEITWYRNQDRIMPTSVYKVCFMHIVCNLHYIN